MIAGLLGDVEDDRGALHALPASPSIVTNAGSFSSQSSSSLRESGLAFYFSNYPFCATDFATCPHAGS